jgi:hypothetical protein
MKLKSILIAAAATAALSSCSTFDDSGRYGDGGSRMESTFSYNGGHVPAPRAQRTGWFSSPQIREAEKKSISRDMPYGVVDPAGNVSGF